MHNGYIRPGVPAGDNAWTENFVPVERTVCARLDGFEVYKTCDG